MAKIERCYGISTGLGYLVGAGGSGKTKELDDLVQKAAVLLKEKLGVNITIRFNTDRQSGGAFVQDGEMSSKIGITAGLYNTAFRKMNTQEKMELTEKEWRQYLDNPDAISVSSCLIENFLSKKSQFVCLDTEFRDFDSIEEAMHWILTGTNKEMWLYIDDLKRQQAGDK